MYEMSVHIHIDKFANREFRGKSRKEREHVIRILEQEYGEHAMRKRYSITEHRDFPMIRLYQIRRTETESSICFVFVKQNLIETETQNVPIKNPRKSGFAKLNKKTRRE